MNYYDTCPACRGNTQAVHNHPMTGMRQVTNFCPICESSARKLEKAEAKLAIATAALHDLCSCMTAECRCRACSGLAAIEKVGETS